MKVAAISILIISILAFYMTSIDPNKINRETNNQIDLISSNMDLLTLDSMSVIAKTLRKLETFNKSPLRYIDFTDTDIIEDQIKAICRRVSQLLLKYLNHIELLITEMHNFELAEKKNEHITRILNTYAKYFETSEINSRLFNLDVKLEETITVLENKYAQITLNEIHNEETKTILGRLNDVASKNIKFKRLYFNIKTSIIKLIEESIIRAGNGKWDNGNIMRSEECDKLMVEISGALLALPTEMRLGLDPKFKTLKVSLDVI